MLPKQNFGVVIMENVGRGYGIIALRDEILDSILGGPSRDWDALFHDLDRKGDAEAEAAKKARDAKRHPYNASTPGAFQNPLSPQRC